MKRLFAAVKSHPDQGFINQYRILQQSLQHHTIKWVEEENFHITIKFFGETMEAGIPAICDVLKSVALSTPDFSFRFEGLGIFGSSYNPKVIWAGIQPHEEFSKMIIGLKHELESLGFPADRQNVVPHLTLGRIRSVRDRQHLQKVLDTHQQMSSQYMMAGKLILFESILFHSGPEYHRINSFPLKK